MWWADLQSDQESSIFPAKRGDGNGDCYKTVTTTSNASRHRYIAINSIVTKATATATTPTAFTHAATATSATKVAAIYTNAPKKCTKFRKNVCIATAIRRRHISIANHEGVQHREIRPGQFEFAFKGFVSQEVIAARYAQLDARHDQSSHVGCVARQIGQENGHRNVQIGANLYGRSQGPRRHELEFCCHGHHWNGIGAAATPRRTLHSTVSSNHREPHTRVIDSWMGIVDDLFVIFATVSDISTGPFEVYIFFIFFWSSFDTQSSFFIQLHESTPWSNICYNISRGRKMADSRSGIALCDDCMPSTRSHRKQWQETSKKTDRRWDQPVKSKFNLSSFNSINSLNNIFDSNRIKYFVSVCLAIHWTRSWSCKKTNIRTENCHGFKWHCHNRCA